MRTVNMESIFVRNRKLEVSVSLLMKVAQKLLRLERRNQLKELKVILEEVGYEENF